MPPEGTSTFFPYHRALQDPSGETRAGFLFKEGSMPNIIAIVRDSRIITLIEEGTMHAEDLNEGDSMVDIPDDQPMGLGWLVRDGKAVPPGHE